METDHCLISTRRADLISIDMGLPKSIFTELVDAVVLEKLPLEKALKVVTSNVASILKLKNKGSTGYRKRC